MTPPRRGFDSQPPFFHKKRAQFLIPPLKLLFIIISIKYPGSKKFKKPSKMTSPNDPLNLKLLFILLIQYPGYKKPAKI